MSAQEHEIFNKNGEKMRTFFIRDDIFSINPCHHYFESKYFLTRHNAGFIMLDYFAQENGQEFKTEKKLKEFDFIKWKVRE